MCNAVSVAVAMSFGDKKAQYMEVPIMQKQKQDKRVLTEAEIEEARERLATRLNIMGGNLNVRSRD